MPYKSASQQKYFHERAKDSFEWAKRAAEWDEKTRKKRGRVKKILDPFENEGPDFNHKAAKTMYDLVMKMDDDTAQMFAHVLVSDVLEETIEKNLPTLQRHLNKVVSKRVEMLQRATLRSISKGDAEEAKAFAEALGQYSEIIKASPYTEGNYQFNESDFNRDPHTGRFRIKISQTQKKPIDPRTAETVGIPKPPNARHGKKLTDEQITRYQDEYRQLSGFLNTVAQSSEGDTDVILQFQEEGSGNRFDVRHTGPINVDDLSSPRTRLIGAVALPNTLTMGGAAFGLQHSLSPNQVKGINALDQGMGDFSTTWSGDVPEGQRALYNRIGAGSKLLGQVGGPKAQIAATLGGFVGSHGHEAEQVIGPTARKTAYRYRGTEKTPDEELVRAYDVAVKNSMTTGRGVPTATSTMVRTAQTRAINDKRKQIAEEHNKNLPKGGQEITWEGVRLTAAERANVMNEAAAKFKRGPVAARKPNWEERDNGRNAITAHLYNKGPSPRLYRLQLASGNTPPSEGVILNSKGQIAAQAVGYGDDHYLPFNLKNLKALKGGEYIRTRSVGGPTSEDIYTGLISGARQIQVTSRSGTYTVTFEDDFRGGRRHNDKARRMTRRYEQLLDAVQSKQVDKEVVSEEVHQLIRDEVMKETEGMPYTRTEKNKLIRDRVEEYKKSPDMTDEDEKILNAQISAATAGAANEGEARKLKSELTGNYLAQKELKYTLNGPGYAAALDALEEQFPYYIKVTHDTRNIRDTYNGTSDKGYVEPGRNRPTAAQGIGLFGTDINQGIKREGLGASTASHANYQNIGGRARLGNRGPSRESETPSSGQAGDGNTSERNKVAHQINQRRQDKAYLEVAAEVQKKIREQPGTRTTEQKRILNTPVSELSKPANQKALDEIFRLATSTDDGKAVVGRDLVKRYERASAHVNQDEYTDDVMTFGPKPYAFSRMPGFRSTDTPLERAEAMKRSDFSAVTADKKLSEMTDLELRGEFNALDSLKDALEINGGRPLDHDQLIATGVVPGSPGLTAGLQKDKALAERIRKVHQVRSLLFNMDQDEKTAYREGKHTPEATPENLETSAPAEPEPSAPSGPGQSAGSDHVLAKSDLLLQMEHAAQFLNDSVDPKDHENADLLMDLGSALRDKHITSTDDIKKFHKENPDLQRVVTAALIRKLAAQKRDLEP